MRFSSQEPPLVQPALISRSARPPKPFSKLLTALYTVIVVTLTIYNMRQFWIGSRLQTLWYPVHTATWVVTANMLVYDGLMQVSPALKKSYPLAFANTDELPRHCAKILRETIEFVSTNDAPGVRQLQGQLAILLAETGAPSEGLQLLPPLQERAAAEFRIAMRAIYGSNNIRHVTTFTNERPTFLESSWSAWRFESRWYHARADVRSAAWQDDWLRSKASQKAAIVLTISSVQFIIIITGLCLLFWLLHTRTHHFASPASLLTFGEGFGIFIRAELCGLLLVLLFSWHRLTTAIGKAYGLLMLAPVVWIIARRHWRHDGAFSKFVGIPASFRAWLTMLGAAIAIVAVDFAFGTGVVGSITALGFEGHWTEGLDESLLYESLPIRMVTLANAIVWIPVYEELAFRGVLFSALRERLGVIGAALISSIVFASIHSYSWPGLLGVAVFGFTNALMFHYTRSLIPCIAAHIIVNFLYFGTEVALFA